MREGMADCDRSVRGLLMPVLLFLIRKE